MTASTVYQSSTLFYLFRTPAGNVPHRHHCASVSVTRNRERRCSLLPSALSGDPGSSITTRGRVKAAYQRATRRQHQKRGADPPRAKADGDNDVPGERLGFCFSPGALLLPYYIGVAQGLEDSGLLTPTTPIAGSSAGSLITMCISSGVDWGDIEGAMGTFFVALREEGTYGRVWSVLEDSLLAIMPDDIHERMSSRATVGISKLQFAKPWEPIVPLTIRDFRSREDAFAAVRASCWTPGWIGSEAYVSFREHKTCLDGLPTAFLPSPEGCERVVNITSSPASGLAALGLIEKGQVEISPDVQVKRLGGKMRFSWPRLTYMALFPSEPGILADLIDLGKGDAVEWASAYRAEAETLLV